MPLFKFKKTVFPDKKTPRWLDVMLIVVLIPIIYRRASATHIQGTEGLSS